MFEKIDQAEVMSTGTLCLQIRFANRKTGLSEDQTLYVSKCYELANHYLGFDGWTTHIIAVSNVCKRIVMIKV